MGAHRRLPGAGARRRSAVRDVEKERALMFGPLSALASAARPTLTTLVCVGDSLTFGSYSSAGMDYPNQLVGLLARMVNKTNLGVPGERTAAMLANIAAADALYSPGSNNVMVIWGGINDIISGVAAASVYANLKALWHGRQALGWRVIGLTLTPSAFLSSATESARQTLNGSIRADGTILLIDVDADPRLHDDTNRAYFYADGTHFVDAGYGVVAALVAPHI